MPFFAIALVLAALGVVNAAYLAYGHRRKALVCPLDHDCSVVTESRWATFVGIRNEVLGMIYFGALFAALLVLVLAPAAGGALLPFIPWAAGAGALYSAALVGIQAFAIKDYCFYCLISALLAILLFFDSFALR